MAELANVYKFSTTLAINDLLGVSTYALNAFTGPLDPAAAVFSDDDGTSDRAENGTSSATFNGHPVDCIGAGDAQFGIKIPLLGNTLGSLLGSPVPVVAFQAGGETYLQFPDGLPPSVLDALVNGSSLLVTFDITSDPYLLPCFVEGTLILTDRGEVPVEQIEVGDTVVTHFGQSEVVRWVGCKKINMSSPLLPRRDSLLPICFPVGSLGKDLPHQDLFVSRQHRMLLEGAQLDLNTGLDRAFAPAHHFEGSVAHDVQSAKSVTYYHILCDTHVVLRANGVPAESMLLGPEIEDGMRHSDTWEELTAIFPELDEAVPLAPVVPAFPVLRRYETQAVV